MATSPSPKQVARMILAKFNEAGNARPGHVLLAGGFTHLQVSNHLTHDEWLAGLQYAGDQGWIENAPNVGIRLTDAGYAEV